MPDGIFIKLGVTTYDASRKQFRIGGRPVSRQSVRSEIDKLTQHVSKEAAKIGNLYATGKINIAEFEIRMKDLIRSGHLIASSVGRGGRERMSLSDWGRVGSRLQREYTYLAAFTRKLATGQVAKLLTPNRAKAYSSSIIMSYHETKRTEHVNDAKAPVQVMLVQHSREGCEECEADAAMGWVNPDELDDLGSRICGPFCLCEILFSDEVND